VNASFARVRSRALWVGLGAGLLTVAGGALLDPQVFFRAYLVGYVFWVGIAVGSLGIALIHQLTGGQWGAVTERLLEAATRTIPWMIPAFVPIAVWLPELYPWAIGNAITDPAIAEKRGFLNIPFFLARTAIYFAAWSLLANRLNRWSREQDRPPDPDVTARMKRLGAGGLVVYGFTVTFAAIDWLMSLEPHWYSTIFGSLVGVGWMLSALAFVIAVAALSAGRSPLGAALTDRVRIDLGSLLLTFVILAMYFHFAQFVIIWTGNIPEEVSWYAKRMRGGWQVVVIVLVVAQFLGPFLLLLSPAVKRSGRAMAALASLLVATNLAATFWLVVPVFAPGRFTLHALDVLTPVALGALWLWRFFGELERRPLLPLGDPALPESVLRHAS
jgi:hypothetical protein